MPIYKSGCAVVQFDCLQKKEGKRHGNFTVTIEGCSDFRFAGEGYACPIHWSDKKVASDMLGWAIDSSMEGDTDLINAVIFDEGITNEHVVVIETES